MADLMVKLMICNSKHECNEMSCRHAFKHVPISWLVGQGIYSRCQDGHICTYINREVRCKETTE